MFSPPGEGWNMQLSSQICPFLHLLHEYAHMAGNGHPSSFPADFHPAVLSRRLRAWAG